MKKTILSFISITLLISFFGCQKPYTEAEKQYIATIEKERQEKNEWMKNDPNSPFNYKSKIEFHDLKYFPVDPNFVFKSKLHEYAEKDSLTIYGTKGEGRPTIRWGYLKLYSDGKYYNVNVYKSKSRRVDENGNPIVYYSIWFTDKTTNEESYGVGRYLDFEKYDDPDFVYYIDFNKAYNPYCAYSPEYSCAIPSKEDYIDLSVEAGEKKFHD